jgi:hypothetical protein
LLVAYGGDLSACVELVMIPFQRLFFGSESINTPLMAMVVSYDHVPTGPLLILEGKPYGFFVRTLPFE